MEPEERIKPGPKPKKKPGPKPKERKSWMVWDQGEDGIIYRDKDEEK